MEPTWGVYSVSFEGFVHFDDNDRRGDSAVVYTTVNQYDSDHDDEEEKVEVHIVSSNVKYFMIGLRQFFEQSKIDEEKCDVIFEALISTLDNTFDQIVVTKLSQKEITDFLI